MNTFKVSPHLTYKIWGGEKLLALKAPSLLGKSDVPLGETWEVSIHPDGKSKVEDGKYLDEKLDSSKLTYLIKFIDTSQNLSIQVHPGQEYAQKFESDNGKNECWIILDANPGSGIYLGFKDGVTPKSFKKSLENGDAINELLRFYPVKRGDFFFVPAGAVHAIGDGITLCEVQRSSGVTYRVWDWNRLENGKPRELHISKAMDVLNFDTNSNSKEYFQYQREIFKKKNLQLAADDLFKVKSVNMKSGENLELLSEQRVTSVVVISGKIEIDNKEFSAYECGVIEIFENELTELQAKEDSEIIIVS